MKNLFGFFVIAILFSQFTQAATWTMDTKSGAKKFTTVEIQGINMSETCSKKCTALNKLKPSKLKINNPIPSLAGHPASKLCTALEGMNRVVTNDKNQQYDFCEFKDKSMVDSWGLYYKHFPKN